MGIMGLFIKEEKPTVVTSVASTSIQPKTTITTTFPATIASVPKPAEPIVVGEMRSTLERSLDVKGNSFDYPKFRKVLSSTKANISDEITRIKVAFLTAQQLNVSKKDLIDSANSCISILMNEQDKFKNESEQEVRKTVSSKQARILEIDNTVTARLGQIKTLNEEVLALSSEKTELQINLETSKQQLDNLSNSFTAAYNELTNEIKNDISKMSTSLEG